jgi:branched-chain amino acid transport system substrate-binding protein
MKRLHTMFALALAVLLAVGVFVPTSPAATVGPVTDQIGVVRVNKGQPITIAYWMVVAGPDASLGVDTRRGVEIAIADKKTVAGFPVRLIGEDTGCNAEGGVTAATKLAANKAIVAAIGSNCSSEAIPGADTLEGGYRDGIAVEHCPLAHRFDPRARLRRIPAHGPQRRGSG